jgi:predicted GTPase
MPGLGEDLEKDEQHKREYKRILPECDVVLWLLNIADREMSSQQQHIIEISQYLEGRLVVCANKADILEPAEWNTDYNMPSVLQEENLERRIVDIRKKLCKYIPSLSEERIVFYSAKKKYRLNDLFVAMMDACPDKRAWVLESRMEVADFTELIDSEILKKIHNG